ncbi:MAG: hypothetical protein NTY69_11320 [Methylococcales bacterium]|nr:hypothetical protein [Methylococcales bacterium]
MSSKILNISNSEEVVTPSIIDYKYEWERRIAGEWVDYYYRDEMTFNEVVCDYVDFEYVKFTIKVCDEDVTLFVHISKDREILKVENPEHHSVSADIILEEVFNISMRLNNKKAIDQFVQKFRFLPRNYRVELEGSFANNIVGELTQKQFNYWNTNVSRYILDKLVYGFDKLYKKDFITMPALKNVPGISGIKSLFQLVIPEDVKLFDKGRWWEPHNLWGSSGVFFDRGLSSVIVYDENGTLVWKTYLDSCDLKQQNIPVVLGKQFNTEQDIKSGAYVFSVDNTDNGLYKEGIFRLCEEFDASKFEFHYVLFNNEKYINRVFYKRREINMGHNNSTGNWMSWQLFEKK